MNSLSHSHTFIYNSHVKKGFTHTLHPNTLHPHTLCPPPPPPPYFASLTICTPYLAPHTLRYHILHHTHFVPPHFVPHTLRPTLCAPILCAPKFCHTNTFCKKLNRSIALIYRPILLLSFAYALFKQN